MYTTVQNLLLNSTIKPVGCLTDKVCRWSVTLKKCLPNPCLGNETFGSDGQLIDYNNAFNKWDHFWTNIIVGISFLAVCSAGFVYYKCKQNQARNCQLATTVPFNVKEVNDFAKNLEEEEVPLQQIVTTI